MSATPDATPLVLVRTSKLRRGEKPVAVLAPCQGHRTYLIWRAAEN
jgi:hypothetical protein